MVSTRVGRHKSERVRPHLCTISLLEGSFLPETVMGTSFHVCAPERVLSDVERRNLLAANGGFAHITIGSAQVRNYVAFRREMDRVRRALGQRKKPRPTGNRDSERNRRHAAMIAHRQFELWDRLLGSSCFKL